MDWRLILLALALWVAIGYLLWEMRSTPDARGDHPPRAGRTPTEERLGKMWTEHGDTYPSHADEWKHHNDEWGKRDA